MLKTNKNASNKETKRIDHVIFGKEGKKTQQMLQTQHETRWAIHRKHVFHLHMCKKGKLPSRNCQIKIVAMVNQSKGGRVILLVNLPSHQNSLTNSIIGELSLNVR